jgi:hypothetical protein
MEVIVWSFDWVGSLGIEEIGSSVVLVNLVVVVAGAIVIHVEEPSSFTKDNDKQK